jgi:hypothetical protein
LAKYGFEPNLRGKKTGIDKRLLDTQAVNILQQKGVKKDREADTNL